VTQAPAVDPKQHPVRQLIALLDALGEPVITTDRHGIVTYLNLPAQQLMGTGSSSVCGASLGEWLSELAGPGGIAEALEEHALKPSGMSGGPVLLRSRLGPLLVGLAVCRSELDGAPLFLCMLRDLTQVRRAEEQMIDAQRLVRSILQNTSEGYVLLDGSGMILDSNPAFESMCGCNALDLREQRIDLFFEGHHRDLLQEWLHKLAEGRAASAEIVISRGEGQPHVLGFFKGAPLFDAHNEQVGVFGLITDITESRAKEEKIEQLAFFDPLTGLANRALLHDKLTQAALLSKRTQRKFALMFLDLDKFKHINDTLNHALGDQLLQVIAQRIHRVMRRSDVVARFGGDEFVIGLIEPRRIEDAARVANKLLDAIAQPVELEEHVLHVTTSIGISVFPDDADNVDLLIRNADLAMYQAKAKGRSRFSYFTPALNERVQHINRLERELRQAIGRDEFTLHYQPKIDSATGNIVGSEALIRWQNATLGAVPPGEFIPLAEETDMIVPIGRWVIEAVCSQLRQWREQGLPLLPISLNISGRQFHRSDFRQQLEELLATYDVAPALLELEITESVLMEDVEATIVLLHELRKLGFSLSIDDFGTGYSSFNYLTRFPIDTLKIDRSFVMGLPHQQNAATVTSAIIGMAKSLGLKIVAEGVETREQAIYLHGHGCDQLQGFLFSKPLPVDDFGRLLDQSAPFAFGSKRLF